MTPSFHELERLWKEAEVACLQILALYFPGGAEENNEIPKDRLSPGRDLNAERPRSKELFNRNILYK
jgi:hypothetical protein